jgi:hypothetical protein
MRTRCVTAVAGVLLLAACGQGDVLSAPESAASQTAAGEEQAGGQNVPPERLEGSQPPAFTERLQDKLRTTAPPGLTAGEVTGQFMQIRKAGGAMVGDVTAYEGTDGASREMLEAEGYTFQGEAEGWPSGVTAAVLDRRPSYYQLLLQTPTAYYNYTVQDSTALADVEQWARQAAAAG